MGMMHRPSTGRMAVALVSLIDHFPGKNIMMRVYQNALWLLCHSEFEINAAVTADRCFSKPIWLAVDIYINRDDHLELVRDLALGKRRLHQVLAGTFLLH